MAQQCQVRGTKPLAGNKISHSNRKSRMRQMPNIKSRRFFLPSEKRWIRLSVSAAAIKDIDKRGIEAVVAEIRARGSKI